MESALIEPFRRGDRAALERVYYLYARNVERIVGRVLHQRDRLASADFADLVQEVFLRAFSDRARAQYDGARDFGPFLAAIARNVVVDWSRRFSREIPAPDILEWFAEEVGEELDPPAFNAALVADAEAYIAALEPDLRAVHHARFVQGMPQRQAADAIGVTRQSLRTLEKKLLHGFRQRLRDIEGLIRYPRPALSVRVGPPNDNDTEAVCGEAG